MKISLSTLKAEIGWTPTIDSGSDKRGEFGTDVLGQPGVVQSAAKAISLLFDRHLRLSPAQTQTILALIHISKGQTTFEASYREIEEEIFGMCPDGKSKRSTIRKRIESLVRFQQDHSVELFERTTIGHRNEGTLGYEYIKSQYEWRLLSGLVSAFHCGDLSAVKVEIEKIAEMPKTLVSPRECRKLSPFRQDRKDLKTATAKLIKVGVRQLKKGIDPNRLVNSIMEDVKDRLGRIQQDENEKRAKRQFIAKFESDAFASSIGLDSFGDQ